MPVTRKEFLKRARTLSRTGSTSVYFATITIIY